MRPGVFCRLSTLLLIQFATFAGEMQLLTPNDPRAAANPTAVGDSMMPSLNDDGRFVLFSSTARNLAGAKTNQPLPSLLPQPLNVFLRDRLLGTTRLVSVNHAGDAGGSQDSIGLALSDEGRYALFQSDASGIWLEDTNGAPDLYVRDMQSNVTHAVGVTADGRLGNRGSRNGAMSADGRSVVFVSDSTDLVQNDTNNLPDIFVRDLVAGQTTLVSRGAKGRADLGAGSDNPSITPDGKYVLFTSTATNLAAGVPPLAAGFSDIYMAEVTSGTVWWVSRDTRRFFGNNAGSSVYPVMSADGQLVAYEGTPASGKAGAIFLFHRDSGTTDVLYTNASVDMGISLDMTPDGRYVAFTAYRTAAVGDFATCIVVADTLHGTNFVASADLDGTVSQDVTSDSAVLDPQGRYVLFLSDSENLVTNTVEGLHLYMRNPQTNLTLLAEGEGFGPQAAVDVATGVVTSRDGNLIAFDAQDNGLVPGDSNGSYDVFVRSLISNTVEMVSVPDPAMQNRSANGSSAIGLAPVSADGRLLVFCSTATDLTTNGASIFQQVYARDMLTGAVSLLSANTNGLPADGNSSDPALSANGRYLAFTSLADDLVPGDTNRNADIFVRDLWSGALSLVSVGTNGAPGNNGSSSSPFISADGRVVIFRSTARNLAFPATYDENLFARDLSAGVTYLLADRRAGTAAISPDGRFVLVNANLVNFGRDLRLWDTTTMQKVWTNALATTGLAVSADGSQLAICAAASPPILAIYDWAKGTSQYVASVIVSFDSGMCFSADGRWLAYSARGQSQVTNQLYLYDLRSGNSQLVSRKAGSILPATGNSKRPSFGPSGRFLLFTSDASDLVPNDVNDFWDIFLYDTLSGTINLVSKSMYGPFSGDGSSSHAAFTPDSRYIILESWASDLSSNDFNGDSDLFLTGVGLSAQISVANQKPVIAWTAESGRQYRVEFKRNLTDSTWDVVPGTIMLQNGEATLTDEAAEGVQRFYRIVAH